MRYNLAQQGVAVRHERGRNLMKSFEIIESKVSERFIAIMTLASGRREKALMMVAAKLTFARNLRIAFGVSGLKAHCYLQKNEEKRIFFTLETLVHKMASNNSTNVCKAFGKLGLWANSVKQENLLSGKKDLLGQIKTEIQKKEVLEKLASGLMGVEKWGLVVLMRNSRLVGDKLTQASFFMEQNLNKKKAMLGGLANSQMTKKRIGLAMLKNNLRDYKENFLKAKRVMGN